MDDSVHAPLGAREPQDAVPSQERIEIIDAHGRVCITNAGAAEPPSGQHWLAHWETDQLPQVRRALVAAWAGQVERFVAPLARPAAGQARCWDISVGPLRDAGGTITAVVAVGRAVDERSQAERALRSLNASLRGDVRALTEAAAEERAHAQSLQRKLSRVTASHRQVREESIDLHDRLLRADGDVALGVRREQALQDRLDLATSAQRLAEQASRQAQKSAAVGQLVAGIAHDFNNMLQVVQMTLDMMALQAEADPRQTRLLARSQEAVGHAVDLARRLLAFGREHPYRAEALDLAQVVAEMVPLIGHGLGPRMALDLAPADAALPIRSDRHSIEQALMNLCVNARDACQGQGRIDIALGVEFVTAEQDSALQRAGRYAFVEVRDDGCGMDAATRARIFEPFFTTKPEGQGTGLGLAQVFGLMRQSEGFATVQSEPGQGTRVRLCFPALDA